MRKGPRAKARASLLVAVRGRNRRSRADRGLRVVLGREVSEDEAMFCSCFLDTENIYKHGVFVEIQLTDVPYLYRRFP